MGRERVQCVDNALHGEQQSCLVPPKSPLQDRNSGKKKKGKEQYHCDLSLYLRKLKLTPPPQVRDLI